MSRYSVSVYFFCSYNILIIYVKNIKNLYIGGVWEDIMSVFFINAILWTLAFYGLFEIVKTLIYLYYFSKVKKQRSTYIVLPIKDDLQDNKDTGDVEFLLRSLIFRILYENDNYIDEILVVDFGIKTETKMVIEKIQKDYNCVKLIVPDMLEKAFLV